ncbi:Cation transport regulator-like protein 2 [Thelohanellus kitauei]|uniref:glutathione-specific gamma-glutamylcyclotransferase n=1 Tax=Thelohanellus kitauei TaxID=669202 RepID=A0A0C2IEG6_THEKT|nr:Cation transport regulator-like protein 2 [Thelohanellus kitauei]
MMQAEDFGRSGWIFGYGSIIWKTNFPYVEKCYGFVNGFSRRFWQGSHDHRGTRDRPGRVVTLIPSENETTWGAAYRIKESDWELVINNLNSRENDGYSSILAKFHPKSPENQPVFDVWIYVAMPNNTSFLGDAPIDLIAQQIIEGRGESGSNVEYLFNLFESLSQIGPWAIDNHTHLLYRYVREKLTS